MNHFFFVVFFLGLAAEAALEKPAKVLCNRIRKKE
jgi:hypothetical protein